MDFDAVIVGGGPAGLSAGGYLAQAGFRVLLLEKESFGGRMMKLEWVVNYPAVGERVAGAALAAEMVDSAARSGLRMEQEEVVEIESYSSCKTVVCADGKAYTCAVVILAGGLTTKKLGVPGEDRPQGTGIISCAICDASLFSNQVVAVCGGGDAGAIEALYLANFAAKVLLIEAEAALSAKPMFQDRVRAQAKIEIRCGERLVEIVGDKYVTGLRVVHAATGRKELLEVGGVLIQVGFEPETRYLQELLPLDDLSYVEVSGQLETEVSGIMAAGDIRHGSLRKVAAAVSDGTSAAITAQRLIQEMRREN
ncbi:thioredoxin reductase [mine drainage metagenome]|uniref:Thioredoxin reductase n=1 Tax=mine drainage metagenome TaxID=410659 RepID=A0A1J5RF54_9ZZZZ